MKTNAKDELIQMSDSEESLSEDDEDAWKLTEDVEKEFFKTLSQIKNKDPKIYEKDSEFFKDVKIPDEKISKGKKSNPLTLRDYERNIIIQKGGELSDEEPISVKQGKEKPLTYVEEQQSLKNSLKASLNDSGDECEDDWGGLFKKREKNEEDKKQEDNDYREWLRGQKESVPDENVEKEMKPLRDYWTNPDLNKDDKFLRDYVLNKKFLENDEDKDGSINGEETLEEEQESDEEKDQYNHRFEEPDQEFIKRYPRVMEHSLRRKNDQRRKKREEVKERKKKEKHIKRVEINIKKKQKKKEIEEKIEELKKLTGNEQLAFDSVLNADMDLDDYDQAMQKLFNEEFYSQDDPNFNPSGYTDYDETYGVEGYEDGYNECPDGADNTEDLHCEDPDFNMDCDYDPRKAEPKDKTRSRRRKDKHRRTTVSEAVGREKPKFDPVVHKSFQEYVDQYYAIDCEDFIGDLPCRFKYRRTVPNSYGLTVEEILAADDKELERWCSIKRIQQLRPEFKEKGDLKVFKLKAADEELKRKILPSLFKKPEENEKSQDQNKKKKKKKMVDSEVDEESKGDINTTENEEMSENKVENINTQDKIKKKKKKSKLKSQVNETENGLYVKDTHKRKANEQGESIKSKKMKLNPNNNHADKNKQKKFNKKRKSNKIGMQEHQPKTTGISDLSDARLLAYGIKPKKFRNKLKYSKDFSE